MQRNFGPLKQQVEEWQALQLSTASAKLLIYQAFIEDETGFPKHLARRVHDLYFQPVHEEFQPRTMWSLSNAFTSAFKELEPIPQYKATAKLAGFLQSVRPQNPYRNVGARFLSRVTSQFIGELGRRTDRAPPISFFTMDVISFSKAT